MSNIGIGTGQDWRIAVMEEQARIIADQQARLTQADFLIELADKCMLEFSKVLQQRDACIADMKQQIRDIVASVGATTPGRL